MKYPRLIVTGSNCTRRAVFAGGKQACKSAKGGSTHTSTCSYFARGLLFRNGAAEAAAISWQYFFLFSSPIFARLRERESEKTLKRTKMSVATPSPFRSPASCGSFRKNRRPVGLHSKARVTGAHLRISRRNSTLVESGASAISIEEVGI